MATIGELAVSVVANTGGLSHGLGVARRELRTFSAGTGIGAASLGRLTSTAAAAGGALLGVSSAAGAIGLGIKLAAEAEKAEVAFTTMIGSASEAKKLLVEIEKFASETPLGSAEITDAARKLLAFNTAAEDVVPTLTRIGDVAAGIGAPIGEIAEIYGKARVQGRLFMEDINQLTGRGIPIIQELARQFGVTDSEVRKLVEEGRVGFNNLERAFVSLTSEGGKFSGMMAAQSKTIDGMLSTMRDEFSKVLKDFGKLTIAGFDLKSVISGVTLAAKDFGIGLQGAAPEIKKSFEGIRDTIGGITIEMTGATNRAEAFERSLVKTAKVLENVVHVFGVLHKAYSMLPDLPTDRLRNLIFSPTHRGVRPVESPRVDAGKPIYLPLPPGIGNRTPTIKEAAAPATVGSPGLAVEEHERLMDRVKSIYESTRTPLEEYASGIAELRSLLAAGVLDPDTAGRAIAELRKKTIDAIRQEDFAAGGSVGAALRGSAEAFSTANRTDRFFNEQRRATAELRKIFETLRRIEQQPGNPPINVRKASIV